MNIQSLIEAYKEFWKTINQFNCSLFDFKEICISSYPNKRVVHLATHAKNKRIKKKNLKRIENYFSGLGDKT